MSLFKNKTTKVIAGVLAVITLLIVGRLLIQYKTNSAREDVVVRDRSVELISVASLQSNLSPLSLVGTISSSDEVALHSQAQGKVTRVNYKQGNKVSSGAIIASVENNSEQAALLQAEGGYASAEAALAKLQKGSRDEEKSILEAQVDNATFIYNEAQNETKHTLQNIFITIDDVIKNKTDILFSNPESNNPKLVFTVGNQQLQIDIENQRFVIGETIEGFNTLVNTETDDPISSLKTAEANLLEINSYLDDVATAVNAASPNATLSQSTIDGWKSAVSAARTNINTSLVQTTGALTNLDAKQTALLVAQKQLEQGVSGGRDEDVAAAEAALKQALGALRAAQAQYEKTIIRAPISGTINSLLIEKGDFLSLAQEVGVVANNNLLEITTFITANDKEWVSHGALALIEGGFEGVVYDVAPAIDKATKKIEVKIALSNAKDEFVNGSTVRVYIDRGKEVSAMKEGAEMIIPISAIKIKNNEIVVFTVDEENVLVEHAVEKGSIVGDGVIILSGLDMNMHIVRDVRGLRAGQVVEIKQ